MTAADLDRLRATADAELSGDPEAALRLYEAIPSFAGSLHHERLCQLAELGDEAPGWLWSRWLTMQARRPLWSGRTPAGPDSALQATLEVAYPHGIDLGVAGAVSTRTFLATMYERDWVLRQLIVYETGGLRELVEGVASPQLLERADHIERWVGAPMGGYRLEGDEGGRLQLTDLGNGQPVEVLDLGLAAEHWPGTSFLGRLVPTEAEPGRMFEWRPLPVDEGTARRVAERPQGWLTTVAAAAQDETLPRMFSYVDPSSMIADLPVRPWLGLLDDAELDDLPTSEGLIDFRDAALVVLPKLLRVVESEYCDASVVRHFAEALLLEPNLYDRIASQFGSHRYARAWWVLAGIVREPARSRCLRLITPGAHAS